MFCGILDSMDGNLHFANAGHPAPRWWHAATGKVEPLREAAGMPLGWRAPGTYHHKRIQVEPGGALLFYSEGVTASQNWDTESFGTARLDELLRLSIHQGADDIRTAVLAGLEEFLAGTESNEDKTLLVIKSLRTNNQWDIG
jgi:sigma-B regulation protein RsbU (phosphoserine phosphatase)